MRNVQNRLNYIKKRLLHCNVHSSNPDLEMDDETYEKYLLEEEELEKILSRAEDLE